MTAAYLPEHAMTSDTPWDGANFVDDSNGGEQGLPAPPSHEHELMTNPAGDQASAVTGPC